MAKKACCPASVAREVKQLTVDGASVGISRLDEVMTEVFSLGLTRRVEISKELLRRIAIYNYIPSIAVPSYQSALLEEYKRRHPNLMED